MKFRYLLNPSWNEEETFFFLSANNTNLVTSQTERLGLRIPHKVKATITAVAEVNPRVITYDPNGSTAEWVFTILNQGLGADSPDFFSQNFLT